MRTWALRGTLHLVAAEDLGWLLPLVAPTAIRSVAARWQQLGLDEDVYAKARSILLDALTAEGPLARAQLVERLAARGVDAGGQRAPHLLRRAALEGLLCHGPGDAYVALRDWVGPLPEPPPREVALGELARRYLDAYGPAGPGDLATWSGLPAGEAREAWAQVEGELVEVSLAGLPAWLPRAAEHRLEAIDGPPAVRLLPAFDTSLLGYRSRRLAIAPEHARRLHPGGGVLRPAITVDGRVAGTWCPAAADLAIELFEPQHRSRRPRSRGRRRQALPGRLSTPKYASGEPARRSKRSPAASPRSRSERAVTRCGSTAISPKTILPPGFSTRRSSRSAASWSGTSPSTVTRKAPSKVASGYGSAVASPTRGTRLSTPARPARSMV